MSGASHDPLHPRFGAGRRARPNQYRYRQIIPARFLRKPRSAGYQNFLFHDLRDHDAAFPLNGVSPVVLVAAANFGCGSSREGAVYALVDAGIRCVIAPSFGDIFAGNAAKNGLLTIVLPDALAAALRYNSRPT